MNKQQAITILEAQGHKITSKRSATPRIDGAPSTTAALIALASKAPAPAPAPAGAAPAPAGAGAGAWSAPIPQVSVTPIEPLPVMARDIQAISTNIEKGARLLALLCSAVYVAGYMFGQWVHACNDWLVLLHRKTCQERMAIVSGYVIDGLQASYGMILSIMGENARMT